jgi:hypothetical protein
MNSAAHGFGIALGTAGRKAARIVPHTRARVTARRVPTDARDPSCWHEACTVSAPRVVDDGCCRRVAAGDSQRIEGENREGVRDHPPAVRERRDEGESLVIPSVDAVRVRPRERGEVSMSIV